MRSRQGCLSSRYCTPRTHMLVSEKRSKLCACNDFEDVHTSGIINFNIIFHAIYISFYIGLVPTVLNLYLISK